MDINQRRIERLRSSMESHDMNAKELSKRTGLSESTISRILAGQVVPRQKSFKLMADALNCDFVWLLGYDESNDHLIQIEKLTPSNQTRLLAYYQAVLDTQEVNNNDK